MTFTNIVPLIVQGILFVLVIPWRDVVPWVVVVWLWLVQVADRH